MSSTQNQVSVPQTTDKTIIFPSKDSRFARNYHPESTDYRVAVDQVNEVLTFTEKTLKDHFSCFYCLGYIWVFFLIITILYHSFGKQFEFRNLSLNEFLFIVILLLVGYLLALLRQRKTEQARIVIQQTLDLHNQRLAGVGVRWGLPEDFPLWIELHNDFRSQNYPFDVNTIDN